MHLYFNFSMITLWKKLLGVCLHCFHLCYNFYGYMAIQSTTYKKVLVSQEQQQSRSACFMRGNYAFFLNAWVKRACTDFLYMCRKWIEKTWRALSIQIWTCLYQSYCFDLCVCVCVCVCVCQIYFFLHLTQILYREKNTRVTLIFYLNKSLYILITVKWLAVAYKSRHFIKPLFFTLSLFLSFFLSLRVTDTKASWDVKIHTSEGGCSCVCVYVCVCVAKESGMLEVVAWCHLQRAFSLEWHCLT